MFKIINRFLRLFLVLLILLVLLPGFVENPGVITLVPPYTSNNALFKDSETDFIHLSAYNKTDSIVILNNDDFQKYASSGDGSASNPYVLENYYVSGTSLDLVLILGTTAHFILRDSIIIGQNVGSYGVHLSAVSNGIIQNVKVYNTTQNLIYLFHSFNITVQNNYLNNGSIGLNVLEGGNITITNNVITKCNSEGIYEKDVSLLHVNNNYLENVSNGIKLETCTEPVWIINNTIREYGDEGIYFLQTNNVEVRNNSIIGGQHGVSSSKSDNITLLLNRFENLVTGVAPSGSNWLIANSSFVNFETGISFLSRRENNTVSGNTLINGSYGFVCYFQKNLVVENNVLQNIHLFGITIYEVSSSNFTENQIDGPKDAGISVSTATNVRFTNNVVGGGFVFREEKSSAYKTLVFSNNSYAGLPIIVEWNMFNMSFTGGDFYQIIGFNASHVYVHDAFLPSAIGVGLSFRDSSFLSINNVTISEAGDSGIKILNSDNIDINKFSVTAISGASGIYFENVVNVSITNSIFYRGSHGAHFVNVTNGFVYGSTFASASKGILIESPSNNFTVNNTIFYKNTEGLKTAGTDELLCYNNTFIMNDYGIRLESESNVIVTYNTFTLNSYYAILVIGMSSANLTVQWNDFKENNHNPGASSQLKDDGSSGSSYDYNYFDDWTTPDVDNNGIVDTPYALDGNGGYSCPHPLTNPIYYLTSSVFTNLFMNDLVTGLVNISWIPVMHSRGFEVFYDVFLSSDNQFTWIGIAYNLTTPWFLWDSSTIEPGKYWLKVLVHSADLLTGEIPAVLVNVQEPLSSPAFVFPVNGTVVSGNVLVSWSNASSSVWAYTVQYTLLYSTNGVDWYILYSVVGGTSYIWGTTTVEDADYYLKVIAYYEQGIGTVSSNILWLKVHNTPPSTVDLLSPILYSSLNDQVNVTWTKSTTTLNASVTYSVYYKAITGMEWILIGNTNETKLLWNTSTLTPDKYLLRIDALDSLGLSSSSYFSYFTVEQMSFPLTESSSGTTSGGNASKLLNSLQNLLSWQIGAILAFVLVLIETGLLLRGKFKKIPRKQ